MSTAQENTLVGEIKDQFGTASGSSKSPKKAKRKSPSPITLRLNAEEKEKLKQLSQSMSVSAYIRQCVFGDQTTHRKRVLRVPVQDEQSLAKVLGLLGQSRIANNLNQLAYQANSGSLVMDEEAYTRIEEAYRHVRFMRRELIKALGLVDISG